MELLLVRKPAMDDAFPGDLLIEGRLQCFALERVSRAIPAGRYPVVVTPSARAARHELWSPDESFRLPLLEQVPDRSGIRIHAANFDWELEGCIAVGQVRYGAELRRSRVAVTALLAILLTAGDIWITVVAPDKTAAQSAD